MSESASELAAKLPERLGDYEPLTELATGGMATLYVARQRGAAGVERLVAIKRVHPHLLSQGDFRDMFLDEARMASLIQHPNVVHLLAVEEAVDELLLVMEYVESVPFSRLLSASRARSSPLPVPVISRIVCDMLAGLHAAHEAVDVRGKALGLVHRDISPQNVIVGVDGVSRLIDFGIARAADRITETASGVIKGKNAYLAPEMLLGKELDRRADIFAAGLVLREALTGQQAFEGEAALYKRVFDSVSPTLADHLDAAREIEQIIKRATRRERDLRYDTAAEMHEALDNAIAPAPSRQVARLVQELCGNDIVLQRASIQEALNATTRVDHPRAHTPTRPSVAPRAKTPVALEASASPPTRRSIALIVAAVAICIAILAVLSTRGRSSGSQEVRTIADSSPGPSIAAPPESTQSPQAAASPPPSAAPSTSGATSPRTAPRAPVGKPDNSALPASSSPDASTPLHANPYQEP
ncbi:MAG: serine/threonine protein kinase [Deltaproteobacteria bacterium]|nr:serine/threonine protein kinase [Deltaproteobacteria bacterium]